MPSSTLLHVPGQQTLDERSVVKLFRGYHRSKRVGPTYTQKESQGGLTVEDSASSLLWLGFNLWSRNFHVPRPWPKKKQWLTDTCAGLCSRHMAVPWTARSSSENTWFGWEWPLRPDPTPFATGINWGNWDPNQAVHVWHILGHTLEKKFKDSC